MPKTDLLAPGHTSCAGCGAAIAMRMILRATGKDIVWCNATGCSEVFSTPYPRSSWKVPWLHSCFENVAAIASGVELALKRKGNTKTKVIAFGGDGATVDIGIGALSGMFERGNDVLYICYDTGAYSNTGMQRSGSTPYGADTTTTPSGKQSIGNITWGKDMPAIAAAHGVPYVATLSIAYPADFENKIKKAMAVKGPAYLHIDAPCPTGWHSDPARTVELARLAVQTGFWRLFEIEGGVEKATVEVKDRKPVSDYLKTQGRFKHLGEKDIKEVQGHIDERYAPNATQTAKRI